jgi:hypothetical protein
MHGENAGEKRPISARIFRPVLPAHKLPKKYARILPGIKKTAGSAAFNRNAIYNSQITLQRRSFSERKTTTLNF